MTRTPAGTNSRPIRSTPALTQSGDINQGAGVATYFPSIDIDPAGNLGMTFMESSSNEYMSMYITGQLAGASPGTMLKPVLVQARVAPYLPFDSPPYRGGDFSGTGVDPVNGSFWTANEYAVARGRARDWGTWIQQFSLQAGTGFLYIRLGNGTNGILVNGASNVLIGGTVPSAANIIGANGGDGIKVMGSSSGLVVQGNYIGTDPNADTFLGNSGNGISLSSNHNTIGGTTPGSRNVISGNTQNGILLDVGTNDTLIQGNTIGTDLTGSVPLPNGGDGIQVISSSSTTIGGAATGAGNLISGNAQNGIQLTAAFVKPNSSATLIAGNFIGVDAAGESIIANGNNGIFQNGGDGTTIGGTASAARNIISGNKSAGISMGTGNNSLIEGNYIGTDLSGTKALGNRIGLEWTNASFATVGGTTASARNIISGNTSAGMDSFVIGSGNELIQGNYIGVDVTGIKALPNNGVGVRIAGPTNNTIGGTVSGAGNVISANNGDGIDFTVGPADGTVVQGNFIGTDSGGLLNLGNAGTGIVVWTNNITIGGTSAAAGNIIAYNKGNVLDKGDGIRLVFSSNHDSFLSNSIHDNAGLGINFGNGPTPNQPWPPGVAPGVGPNDDQNYPVLTSAASNGLTNQTEIQGSLNAQKNTSFTIQFFASPTPDPSGYGEGQIYLGQTTVTTDSTYNAAIDYVFSKTIPAGYAVTATATDPLGNTSEFAHDIPAQTLVDVSIAASALPDPVFVGSTLVYTLTVTNNGSVDAQNVTVTDTLDPNVTFVSASGGGTAAGNVVTFNLGTLAANTFRHADHRRHGQARRRPQGDQRRQGRDHGLEPRGPGGRVDQHRGSGVRRPGRHVDHDRPGSPELRGAKPGLHDHGGEQRPVGRHRRDAGRHAARPHRHDGRLGQHLGFRRDPHDRRQRRDGGGRQRVRGADLHVDHHRDPDGGGSPGFALARHGLDLGERSRSRHGE